MYMYIKYIKNGETEYEIKSRMVYVFRLKRIAKNAIIFLNEADT